MEARAPRCTRTALSMPPAPTPHPSPPPCRYAVNSTGGLVFSFVTGGPIFSSPAVGPDGFVYFGSHDFNVYCALTRQHWYGGPVA